MEDFLDPEETLHPDDSDQPVKRNNFPVAIGVSLVLHLILSIVVVGLPGGPAGNRSVTYIDLTMPQQQAAPMTAPAQAPRPEAAPAPEEKAEPEEAPAPAAPPQTAEAKPAQDQPAAIQNAKPEEDRSRTTLGLGLTKGYFRSLGEGETLRAGVKEYYMAMLQEVNEKWWMDQQLDKKKLDTIIINLVIARNGQILNSQVLRSSGNYRYDKAVVAALTAASPLPPLPPDFQGDFFEAPIRLVPPLNLMAW